MNPAQLLARDVGAARKRLHLTTAVMASQIGISESALRRIENGTSKTTRLDTAVSIMMWAEDRGYRHFAGVRIDWPVSRAASFFNAQRRRGADDERQGGLFG